MKMSLKMGYVVQLYLLLGNTSVFWKNKIKIPISCLSIKAVLIRVSDQFRAQQRAEHQACLTQYGLYEVVLVDGCQIRQSQSNFRIHLKSCL